MASETPDAAQDERKIRGRWHVRIDPTELKPGDVVEYTTATLTRGLVDRTKEGQRRCHRVAKVRDGEFKPELHGHEQPQRRWLSTRNVLRAWRRRGR